MNKLLASNFSRILKSKILWVELIAAAVIGVLFSIDQYRQKLTSPSLTYSLDTWFFLYTVYIGIFIAVFCSLFLGTEFSNGTIRNKLIVGHTRSAIYMANLMVSIAASLLMCFVYITVYCVTGLPLIGGINSDISLVITQMVISIFMVIALTSVFTMLTMLLSNKAVAAVVCMLTFVILICLTAYVQSRIDAPVFYDGYVLSVNGVPTQGEQIPNPQYLKGITRSIFQFIYDFLPTGQGVQLVRLSINASNVWILTFYSLLITVITNLVGVLCFKRKDLK